MGIPKRFYHILPWLHATVSTGKSPVPLPELAHFLFSPSKKRRGARYIDSLTQDGDHYNVQISGYESPIYWPVAWGLDTLGMIVSEQFDTADWHYYQVAETRVNADDVVIDCGAAEGLFSLVAAQICRHVYAIEPLPLFCENLQKTFIKASNVEILPYLVSDKLGEASLQSNGISSTMSLNEGTSIPVETLDHLFADSALPITYIKADLEGSEMLMLNGARELISQFKPKIAITTYHKPEHAKEITELLKYLNPNYKIKVKGMMPDCRPVMLHAWN